MSQLYPGLSSLRSHSFRHSNNSHRPDPPSSSGPIEAAIMQLDPKPLVKLPKYPHLEPLDTAIWNA